MATTTTTAAPTIKKILAAHGLKQKFIAEKMSEHAESDIHESVLSRLINTGMAARVHVNALHAVLVDELGLCTSEQLQAAIAATEMEKRRKMRDLWNSIIDDWEEDSCEVKRRRKKRNKS